MAIDRARTQEFIRTIQENFEVLTTHLPMGTRNWLRGQVLGVAIGELQSLVSDSRPPVLYLLGRSGHGKSSLLNALAGRPVAEVGHVRPQTPGADPHLITFEEFFAEWKVVDARGIFETPVEGAEGPDPLEQAKEDIRKYRPDVILHVVTASEARAFSNDIRVFREIQQGIRRDFGGSIPSVMVLTKVDLLGEPDAWPPAEHAAKAGLMADLLDYVGTDVLKWQPRRINLNSTLAGSLLDGADYVGVIPVSVLPSRLWNLDTLTDLIGDHLPRSAILDFAQALQRKELLRRIAARMTHRVSTIAALIGSSPTPVADIVILTPLQLLLVSFVGGLSCRELSKSTAMEFTAATGVNLGFAFAAREGARAVVKLLPGAGIALSGGIAGATTYGIGKSAEAYFFRGEVERPRRYFLQWARRKESDGESERRALPGEGGPS